MAFVVKYVKVEIKESFLNFLPLHGKTIEEITNSILNELHENELDVLICRGQAYDQWRSQPKNLGVPKIFWGPNV